MLPKPYPAKSSLLPFLIISLLIHALGFWWLIRMQAQAVAPMLNHKNSLPVIKARLWQAPVPAAPETEPQAEAEAEQAPEPLAQQPETPELVPVPQPQLPDQKVVEQPMADRQQPDATESVSESEAKPVTPIEYQSAAQRHLSGWQARQRQQVAKQAAGEYRQQRQNPIGEIPDYSEKLSEDEKLHQAIVKEVNCDAGINSILVKIMALGGDPKAPSVRCTDRGAFQQYIDKRLNKARNE